MTKRSSKSRRMGWFERGAWIAGFSLVGIYAGAQIYMEYAKATAFAEFRTLQHATGPAGAMLRDPSDASASSSHTQEYAADARKALLASAAEPAIPAETLLSFAAPDTSVWSAGRIRQHLASANGGVPHAILRIDALELEVPVYVGANEWNLNRGAGLIAGTARIGAGNTGLAAHRDGYFRALEHIQLGDRIELETLHGRSTFLVSEIRIVPPTATEVLAPSAAPAVTLVTCYPFYFVGPAPERFVVRAEIEQSKQPIAASTL